MITNFITMNGYGLFVWLSFGITFFSCSMLYYKTLKKLKKQEKNFADEINKLPVSEKKNVIKNSKIATQILASYKETA